MATKGTILVGTIGQGVMMSGDDGASWTRASVRLGMHSDAIVKCLLADPERPETVYAGTDLGDRKSTRLNSSHITISYAVFCLKKKKKTKKKRIRKTKRDKTT